MGDDVLQGYVDAAANLVGRFEAISSAALYAHLDHLLPDHAARLVDIGAGTGRDAAWFAAKGYDVLAVEPVAAFREAGERLHPSPRIAWLDDRLPALRDTVQRHETFDVVMLSGVWQHLDDMQRRIAMPNLRILTSRGGHLIISVRHGPGAAGRPCYPTQLEDVVDAASEKPCGLSFVNHRSRYSKRTVPLA